MDPIGPPLPMKRPWKWPARGQILEGKSLQWSCNRCLETAHGAREICRIPVGEFKVTVLGLAAHANEQRSGWKYTFASSTWTNSFETISTGQAKCRIVSRRCCCYRQILTSFASLIRLLVGLPRFLPLVGSFASSSAPSRPAQDLDRDRQREQQAPSN